MLNITTMFVVNSCANIFSNSSCEEALNSSFTDTVYATRLLFTILSSVECLFYLVQWFRLWKYMAAVTSDGRRLKYWISLCLTLGYGSLTVFYVLGNHMTYKLDELLGFVCAVMLTISSVSIFTALVMFLVMVQHVYVSTCGNRVKDIVLGSLKSLYVIVIPLVVASTVLMTLCTVGVIVSPVTLTRIQYSVAVLPITTFAMQTKRYGRLVINAIEQAGKWSFDGNNRFETQVTGDRSVLEQMNHKSKLLKKTVAFSVFASAVSAFLYLFASLTPIMNHPFGFLAVQISAVTPYLLTGFVVSPMFTTHRYAKVGAVELGVGESSCGTLTS